ncbi:MAG TPA: type II toxin-antitoxin system VapC family toxin [Thermomicrobiales bacterium]|nr:type II toxin-antitoxin system VapC family toxin [Thermomicrobiales bacterium]
MIEYLKGHQNYPTSLRSLQTLMRWIHPFFPTYRIMERYAEIRRSLRPPYGPGLIGDIDTLIAATALERNLTVVTVDRDFQRVPGLQSVVIDLSNQAR